jgi:lysozyme
MAEQRQPSAKGAVATLVALVGTALAGAMLSDQKQDEGERRVAYQDVGGVWTICRGTTKGVHAGMTATALECEAMSAADLIVAVKGVERCSPALAQQGRYWQLRAAVRFNNNTGAFCKSWWRKRPSIAALINSGQWCAAGAEMLRYNLVKGRPIYGLTVRRRDESRMFLTGVTCQ